MDFDGEESPSPKKGPSWLRVLMKTLLYRIICGFFRWVTFVFFREVLKRGSHQIPTKGPVIFVSAPHANQFVDPLVIMQTCPRAVRFLMAAASMRKGVPGFFGRLLRCIPVERPMDSAKKATGTIALNPNDPTCLQIVGKDTRFTEEFTAGSTSLAIVCPPDTISSVVEKVESDELLFLRSPLERTARERLSSPTAATPFLVLPVIDQSEVYSVVFEVLEKGECLGIFPEGGSHDRAEMLPLKAGVAIMALGAMARKPDLDVTIVPCGLNYFNPDKFRSRAIIEYGEPVKIDRKLVELFRAGGESRKEACGRLLGQIFYSLCSVTVNVPDFETLQVMQATRRLYQPSSQTLSTFTLLEITRRFIKGYLAFENEPRIKRLRHAILEYNQLLKHFRLYDHQVKTTKISRARAGLLLVSQLLLLLVYGAIIFPGIILNIPAVFVIDYICQRKAAKAVSASSVKLKGRDVLATWKLIVGLVILPCLYWTYSAPLAYRMHIAGFGWVHIACTVFVVATVLLPLLSYLTVLVAERGYETYASIRPLWFSVISPRFGEVIRSVRHRLKGEIIKVVNEYGPKLFGDFESRRIVPLRRHSVSITEDDLNGSADPTSDLSTPVETIAEDEIDEIMEKTKSISRGSSPAISVDGLDTVISGFEYMRGRVNAVFSSGDPSPAASDWSHVESIEIDDIFFTVATESSKDREGRQKNE